MFTIKDTVSYMKPMGHGLDMLVRNSYNTPWSEG